MLIIESHILNGMIAVAESTMEECCGFVFGNEHAEQRAILKSLPVRNAIAGDKCTNFEISANDYLRAEELAEQENLTLLGVYHTHPNQPAVPSEYDQLTAQPYFSYVIVSVIDRKVAAIRSWQLNTDSRFSEEKIELEQTL